MRAVEPIRMRIFAALAAFLAGACCTSLPKLPAKRVAFPQIAPSQTTRKYLEAKKTKLGHILELV